MTTHMKLALHDINDGRDIGIIEDTLPEVYDTDIPGGAEVSMGNPADGEYSVSVHERAENTADWHYRAALCHLAMWQYKLGEGARKAAAEEARDRRRNELAAQLTPLAATYAAALPAIQNAIDMIIELEGKP